MNKKDNRGSYFRSAEFQKKMSESRKGKPGNALGKHWAKKDKTEKPKEDLYVFIYDPTDEEPWGTGHYKKLGESEI